MEEDDRDPLGFAGKGIIMGDSSLSVYLLFCYELQMKSLVYILQPCKHVYN